MHLFDQGIIGILILFLLAILVIVKQVATGFLFDKPAGSLLMQVVNLYNLFFLLLVNPMAAVLLITRGVVSLDPTHLTNNDTLILMFLEIAGLVMYVTGFVLMAWALITLRRNYQLGGSTPRLEDEMVVDGPYRLIRHPMYTAALSISLGLACLLQSWALVGVFCIYLGLILRLIPIEEKELDKAYSERYLLYTQRAGRLLPLGH